MLLLDMNIFFFPKPDSIRIITLQLRRLLEKLQIYRWLMECVFLLKNGQRTFSSYPIPTSPCFLRYQLTGKRECVERGRGKRDTNKKWPYLLGLSFPFHFCSGCFHISSFCSLYLSVRKMLVHASFGLMFVFLLLIQIFLDTPF